MELFSIEKMKKEILVSVALISIIASALSPGTAEAKTKETRSVKLAMESLLDQTGDLRITSNSTLSLSTVNDFAVEVEEVVEAEPEITAPTKEEVKAEIVRQAKEYGVNEKTALRIAFCESSYKFDAKNPHGSAKGVYQFIDGTWKYIGAEGHQFDYKENIRQFMIHYPKNPGWWECK